MKVYVARTGDGHTVEVSDIEGSDEAAPLEHRMHHSPDGFAWGYGGSGPSDLARSLLWDVLGEEPPRPMYMEFKFDVVAGLPDYWALSEGEIETWIEGWKDEQEAMAERIDDWRAQQ